MKRIRWGFLSTAAIGASAYVPALRASRNGVLHAVASRDPAKAREFAAAHGFVRAHDSYEALLADPEVDAVYNPLPNALHAEWTMKAADAGKAVLCEKPLAANAAEARRMVEHSRRKRVLLAEAFMYRYHPLTRTAVELVRTGRIGTLRAVRTVFYGVDGKPGDDIRFSQALAGGAVRDLGCYCLGILRLVTGEEPDRVEAVSEPLPSGVDGRTSGVLHFPSGVVGSFDCGMGLPFACAYEFTGTGGRLVVDEGAMVAWPGAAFTIKLWPKGGAREDITVPPANHYQLMAEAFADALLGGPPLEFGPEDAVRGMELIDRVLKAAGTSS